jgi:hypothetical protein
MRFGIVCEGSHDFVVLSHLVSSALQIDRGNITAIQPQLDATLSQIGAGGFHKVKIWCLQNSGPIFYQNIGQGLFKSSITFDHILVHLDGDVIEKSNWFSPVQKAKASASVQDRCALVSSWIEQTLAFSGADELCTAVPTLSTDAWVLATIKPARCLEHYEVKHRLTRYLRRFFGSNKAHALDTIMPFCSQNIYSASLHNPSLDAFIKSLP